jgi:dihydroxy-acid dehydratase
MTILNKYSRRITQEESQPGSQAMLHAIGLDSSDLSKAQVGIASTGWDGNPCNMHLNGLAEICKESVNGSDLIGLIFHTIGVSDGISMGTDGMKYSLPSRDLIADSIETVVSAQWYDALVAVVGCDKNMPGAFMAAGRLNRPSIIVYGGTISPGIYHDQKLDIVSAFEALGRKSAGEITPEEFREIVRHACPGPGACGGMYTANTMSSAIEALGLSLPFSSSNPAVSKDKTVECGKIGPAIYKILEKDLKPRDIVSFESFENAIRLITILGGSTNAVMHLMAMAHAFGIKLTIDDFHRISDSTPYLADLKPSGKYVMEDLYNVGGIPAVMKLMFEEGLLIGDCLSVTGNTIAENLAEVESLKEGQDVVHALENPIKPNGHLRILYGNLASEGAVAKITGKEGEVFSGEALVFNSEAGANTAILEGKVQSGQVIVIRYCGPKGGPGMPEMLKPTSLIMGAGLGQSVALITDGRFSGGTHGFVVGHITPESFIGGNLALVENGDRITIDARQNRLDLHVSDDELERRRNHWQRPDLPVSGILKKYRHTVSSASHGCVTDQF